MSGLAAAAALMALVLAAAPPAATLRGVQTGDGCAASDAELLLKRKIVCSSLTQQDTPWCGAVWDNVTAKEDWPNQAIYMQDLLGLLLSPSTCLNTSYANDTVRWLNSS